MDSSRVISDCLRWMRGSIELERLHQKFWGSDPRTVRKGWALHPSARFDILHPLVLIGRGGQFPTIGFEMTRVISTDVASDIIQCTHRQVPMMPRLAARKLTFHLKKKPVLTQYPCQAGDRLYTSPAASSSSHACHEQGPKKWPACLFERRGE